MYPFLKRGCDIVFSLLGIILCAPILLIFIFLLLLSGESTPIYSSYRVGFGGELFKMYKLRTMKRVVGSSTKPLTAYNDSRISFLGRLLRFSKIDELPQFFNILNGDLSFVGPRPMLPEVFMYYSEETREQLKGIRPGVTGIGSIVFRNEGNLFKNIKGSYEVFYRQEIAPLKGELERWYISKKSFKVDFKILVLTLVAVTYGQVKSIHTYFKNLPSVEIQVKDSY